MLPWPVQLLQLGSFYHRTLFLLEKFSVVIYCLIAQQCPTLLQTLWTAACQAPLSMGFSRQKYWSGISFPSSGDLPNPGIKPKCLLHCRQILYHWATWKSQNAYEIFISIYLSPCLFPACLSRLLILKISFICHCVIRELTNRKHLIIEQQMRIWNISWSFLLKPSNKY